MTTLFEEVQVVHENGHVEVVVLESLLDKHNPHRVRVRKVGGSRVRDLIPAHVDDRWTVVHSGKVVPFDQWQSYQVRDGELMCFRRVRGAVGRIIAGAILTVIGIIAVSPFGWFGAGYAWGPYVLAAGLSLLAGGVAGLLIGRPGAYAFPSDGGGTSTYGFGGVQNNLRSGAPIPVLYGRHRIGGSVISAYTRPKDDNDVLYVLLGLSEGPIQTIYNIQINGQPSENFRDVQFEYRPGASTQDPIGLFGTETVEQVGADAAIPNGSYAQYTTSRSDVTAIEIGLTFPGGLFNIDGSGNFSNRTVTLTVEYKLSSSGTWINALINPSAQNATAPTVAKSVNANGSFVDGESVSYLVVFVTKFGESLPSPASTPLAVDSGYQVDLTNIPLGNSTTLQRRLYRKADAIVELIRNDQDGVYWEQARYDPRFGVYYYLATIDDNTTTTYTDLGRYAEYSTPVFTTYDRSLGPLLTGIYTDARRSTLRRLIRIDNQELGLTPGQYDVRLSRTTAQTTSSSAQDEVRRSYVNEIVGERYSYPYTALLAVKALGTDQLSGFPTVTVIAEGRQVWVWTTDLTYLISYTRNPAWQLFDLLTNSRYGTGRFIWAVVESAGTANLQNGVATVTLTGATTVKMRKGMVLHVAAQRRIAYIASIDSSTQFTLTAVWAGSTNATASYEVRKNDIDIPSVRTWAAFCDELIIDYAGVKDVRATSDLYYDAENTSAWDAAQKLCALGRASLVKVGNYLKVMIEQATTPVQLFTMGNIIKDSFNLIYMSLNERANIFEVQFLNEKKDYEQDFVIIEDPLIGTNQEPPRKHPVSLYGITRSFHAAHMARYLQNVNRYLTRTIQFEAEADALAIEPGDVFNFQHDVPQWSYGGRVIDAGFWTVDLETPVTLNPAVTSEILIRRGNSDALISKPIQYSGANPMTRVYLADNLWAQGNGSFEGTLEGWAPYETGSSVVSSTEAALIGTSSLKITSSSSIGGGGSYGGGYTPNFPSLTAGQAYRLSFWVKTNPDFTDDFNRADEYPLTGNWSSGSTIGIVNNQLAITGGFGGHAIYEGTIPSTRHQVWFTLHETEADDNEATYIVGIGYNTVSGQTYELDFGMIRNQGGDYELWWEWWVHNGTTWDWIEQTRWKTTSHRHPMLHDGCKIRVEIHNPDYYLRWYVDDVEIHAYDNTSYTVPAGSTCYLGVWTWNQSPPIHKPVSKIDDIGIKGLSMWRLSNQSGVGDESNLSLSHWYPSAYDWIEISKETTALDVAKPKLYVYSMARPNEVLYLDQLVISKDWDNRPQKGDLWAVGATGVVTKPFRCLSIQRTPENRAKITAIEYVESVYDDSTPPPATERAYSGLNKIAGPPSSVTNLTLSQPLQTFLDVWVSWDTPASGNFRTARIYRTYADRPNLFLGESETGSFVIDNALPNTQIDVLVTSVSHYGIEQSASDGATGSILVTIQYPPDVTGLSDFYADGVAWLVWDPVEWLIPVEYEIRKGDTWVSSIPIGFVVDYLRVALAGDGKYWVATRDANGTYSQNPASITIVGTLFDNNVVATITEHSAWTGTVSGDADKYTHGVYGLVIRVNGVGTGTYEIATGSQVDLGTVKEAFVSGQYLALGESTVSDWDSIPDIDAWADVDGEYSQYVTVRMYVATSDAGGTFGAWKNLVPGMYTGRKFKFKIVIENTDATVWAIVKELSFLVDMPDLNDSGKNVAISASGSTINFNVTFQQAPSVQITILDSQTGDEVYLPNANISTTGFDVTIKNGGTGVARNINWFADGY